MTSFYINELKFKCLFAADSAEQRVTRARDVTGKSAGPERSEAQNSPPGRPNLKYYFVELLVPYFSRDPLAVPYPGRNPYFPEEMTKSQANSNNQ